MPSKSLLVSLLLAVSAGVGLTGCVAAIGNRPPPASSATLGQQLIDLKKAHDDGLLSPAEYEAQRAKFLNEKRTESR